MFQIIAEQDRKRVQEKKFYSIVSGNLFIFASLDVRPLPVVASLGLLRLPLSDDDVLLLELHGEGQQVIVNLHQTMSGKVKRLKGKLS
jgi:hypothetical protein